MLYMNKFNSMKKEKVRDIVLEIRGSVKEGGNYNGDLYKDHKAFGDGLKPVYNMKKGGLKSIRSQAAEELRKKGYSEDYEILNFCYIKEREGKEGHKDTNTMEIWTVAELAVGKRNK